jgi:hypothetical protein
MLMDKMKIDTADRPLELLNLLRSVCCAPIEAILPVIDEVPHIGDAPVAQGSAGNRPA